MMQIRSIVAHHMANLLRYINNKMLRENKLPTAEQRGINQNIPNRPKGRGINAPEAHKTFTRLRRVYPPCLWRARPPPAD